MNQQEIAAATSIGLLYLIRMLGLFMVLPVLPLLGQDVAQATPFLIGIAIGIYGLSQALLQIPFGLLSDRLGRKKVIAAGLLLFVAGSFVAGFSTDIYGLIVGRFMQGCGAIASTLLALMSDLTRVDQRGKSMAIIGAAIGGSFGLSLVLGPFVANAWGLAGIFNLTGMLGLLGLALLLFRIPTPTIRATNLDATLQTGGLGTVLKDLNLWRVNVSIFLLHYLLVSAFSVLPLMFEASGRIETDEHALYYLVLLLVSFVAMLPLMRLSDRLKDNRGVLAGTVGLSVLAFGVLVSLHGYWWLLLGAVLFFMAFNLLEVMLPAQLSKMSVAGTRGTAMGVYSTCQFMGIFAGGVVSGWILMHGDLEDHLLVNLFICMGWLLMCLGFPDMGQIASRTVTIDDSLQSSDTDLLERLLSVHGVTDAVIIAQDQVAYLKVDESILNENELNKVIAPAAGAGGA